MAKWSMQMLNDSVAFNRGPGNRPFVSIVGPGAHEVCYEMLSWLQGADGPPSWLAAPGPGANGTDFYFQKGRVYMSVRGPYIRQPNGSWKPDPDPDFEAERVFMRNNLKRGLRP